MTTGARSAPPLGADDALLQLLYLCPVGILKLDAHGTIVLMNPYGAQLLMPVATGGGFDNLFDLFAPFAPEVSEMARRFPLRAGKVCEEHRIALPLRAGADRTTIISITLQKIDVTVYVAVLTDVTSAAAREFAIRASEERLHAVLDGVKEYAVCTVDAKGIVMSWNRAAERLDDYRADEAIGRHLDFLVSANGVAKSPMGRRLELAAESGSHEFEGWRVRKDGKRYWASTSIGVLLAKDGHSAIGFSVITRDLTEERRAEDRLRALAMTDPLTGALNRRSFFEHAKRDRQRPGAPGSCTILLIDADFFKTVNDTFGHEAGDATLQRIVGDCRKEIRSNDILGRFGGEEFAIFLPASACADGVGVAERIRERIAHSGRQPGSFACTVSIGVAGSASSDESLEAMIHRADVALYEAKARGRNCVVAASAGAAAAAETILARPA